MGMPGEVPVVAARRRKERTHPELVRPGHRRHRWRGRWVVGDLVKARSRCEPAMLQKRAEQGWRLRWGSMRAQQPARFPSLCWKDEFPVEVGCPRVQVCSGIWGVQGCLDVFGCVWMCSVWPNVTFLSLKPNFFETNKNYNHKLKIIMIVILGGHLGWVESPKFRTHSNGPPSRGRQQSNGIAGWTNSAYFVLCRSELSGGQLRAAPGVAIPSALRTR